MTFKSFHLRLVTSCGLLALVFGGWIYYAFRATREPAYLVLALACWLAGAALIGYGLWFRRRLDRLDDEQRRRRESLRLVDRER